MSAETVGAVPLPVCYSCRWSAWSLGAPGLYCAVNTRLNPPRDTCALYEYEPGTDAAEWSRIARVAPCAG